MEARAAAPAKAQPPAAAVARRRLPGKLPVAIAMALMGGGGGGGADAAEEPEPVEGSGAQLGRRLLLVAPGPELVVLDVSDPQARLQLVFLSRALNRASVGLDWDAVGNWAGADGAGRVGPPGASVAGLFLGP